MMDETYLYHYGILGQKWGIRRFQNEDGTRTVAGKQRYSKSGSSETKRKVNTETLKTAGKIALAAATVATAAYAYSKNKTAVDNAVKNAFTKFSQKAHDVDAKLDALEKKYNESLFKKYCDRGKKYADAVFANPFMKGVKKVGAATLEGVGIIAGTKLATKLLGEEESSDLIEANNAYKKKDDKIKNQKVIDIAAKTAKKEVKNYAEEKLKIKRKRED